MTARRASICRRYRFQQIENQHLIGHSIERQLFAHRRIISQVIQHASTVLRRRMLCRATISCAKCTRRIYPNVDGIRNSIRVLSLTNERFGRLKAEELIDDRSVRKLEKESLF